MWRFFKGACCGTRHGLAGRQPSTTNHGSVQLVETNSNKRVYFYRDCFARVPRRLASCTSCDVKWRSTRGCVTRTWCDSTRTSKTQTEVCRPSRLFATRYWSSSSSKSA